MFLLSETAWCKCSTYSKGSSCCSHPLHNLYVGYLYQISHSEVCIPPGGSEVCQRLEIPRKTIACHLRFSTLWVECFQEKYLRQKGPACLQALHLSQGFSLLVFASSIFSSKHPTLLPLQFLSRLITNFNVGVTARRELSWLSQVAPPLGQHFQGIPGPHWQHTPTRQHP